jgi:hypothetical protein
MQEERAHKQSRHRGLIFPSAIACRAPSHGLQRPAPALLAILCAAAKSLVPESHPQHMGTYFGQISDPCVAEVVESADAYLFCGPLFNDYAAVGNTLGVTGKRAAPFLCYLLPAAVTVCRLAQCRRN